MHVFFVNAEPLFLFADRLATSHADHIHDDHCTGPPGYRIDREVVMPVEFVLLGGILVVAGGALIFVLIRRHKTAEPPHFR